MTSPLVVGVDCSTTSTKAIVVDAEGAVLAQAKAELDTSTPRADFYEQDPRDWWRSTDAAVAGALALLSPGDRARVTHLCATVQRQSFALVDEEGRPLRPAILWLDGRAAEQVRRLGTEDVHRLTGFQPDVTPSVYKIAWLAEHEPEVLARARRVVGVHAYLVHALTGRWLDSAATADSLGLFDMARLEWADAMVAACGLRRDQLPELAPAASELGTIRTEISRGWGLAQEVQLVAACGDGQAAALGVGATGPGEAYLNMGTALVAGVHSRAYRWGSVFRTDAAGLPGQYVLEIVQNSGAYLAGWFRERLGDPVLAGRPDELLEEAAARVPAGCGGLVTLPYWNAAQSPYWNPLARGAYVGLAGVHDRAALYRSTLEGVSVAMARNLAGLESATGVPLQEVTVAGGGRRSPLWRRIMADAAGLPLVESLVEEASAMGAAAMAMAATGEFASVEDAARSLATRGQVTEPDPAAHAVYTDLGELQAEAYERLAPVFEAQHTFARRHPLA